METTFAITGSSSNMFINGSDNGQFTSDVTKAMDLTNTTHGYTSPSEGLLGQPLISAGTKDLVLEVVNCGFLPTVCLFGIVGNIMSFVVLCVQGSKERVNVILFGMAVSDTLFLVTALMRKLNCLVSKVDTFAADDLSTIMKSHVLVLNILFGRITTLLIMLIAIERFIAVYLPLKAHYLLTPRRMIVAVTILYISATIAMAPALNLYETVWVYNSQQNRTVPFLKPTKFNLDNLDFFSFYLDQFLNFVFRYIPLFLVCLFTALVVSKLKRSASWRRRISSTVDKVKDDDRTTSMLLLVNAIYLICVIPGTITITVRFIVPEFDFRGRYANTFNLIGGFILLFESCNSSVNFIVYMAMSRRFSATYKSVFLCRRMPVFKYGESQVTHLPSSSGSAP